MTETIRIEQIVEYLISERSLPELLDDTTIPESHHPGFRHRPDGVAILQVALLRRRKLPFLRKR